MSAARDLRRLESWELDALGLHPQGSNYVFVARLKPPADEAAAEPIHAIYKPVAGERPLADFPHGTLHRREAAAFALSRRLGWPLVPPTVVREGPYGEGSWQMYVEHDPGQHYFQRREEHLEEYAPVAMFDVLVNNADRKGSAVLMDGEGRLWAIDNGLTFNYGVQVRTVMHEFGGAPYPPRLLKGLAVLAEGRGEWRPELERLLGAEAADALAARAGEMVAAGRHPELSVSHNVPYPLI